MSLYDKASENYAIASLAFRENRYNAAASRLYYALYQACVKTHMENGRNAVDFMSATERKYRAERLRTNTDAPKWPHDVLVRYASLHDLGLNDEQIRMIIQALKLRVTGDYGDNEKVRREDLRSAMERAKEILRQLRVPVAGR